MTSEQIVVYGFNLHARCLIDIRLVSTGQLNKNYVSMRQCVGCAKRHYVCMWGWIQENYACSFLSKIYELNWGFASYSIKIRVQEYSCVITKNVILSILWLKMCVLYIFILLYEFYRILSSFPLLVIK